jgi:hypothetical protein
MRKHDLRHTYATLLLARGTHPTHVQKSLGHASVQLTLDRNSNLIPSMGRATAEGMEEASGSYCCQSLRSAERGFCIFTSFAGRKESRRADSNR